MDHDSHEMLVRIDERTKSMFERFIAIDKRLDSHSIRTGRLERDRNIMYGAWMALATLFGFHVKGGG